MIKKFLPHGSFSLHCVFLNNTSGGAYVAECQEERIQANGLSFALKRWGNAEGVPTLALHGWLDNAASFDLLAPQLDGLNLCAVDLAGHGLSEHRPLGTHYYVSDYAADMLAVADALGWQEFNLLGHSLGANIAVLMAGICPERINKLVLIEGFGPHGREPDTAVSQLRTAFAKMKNHRPDKLLVAVEWDTLIEKRMHSNLPVNRRAAELLCERGAKAVEGGWTWRSDPRLRYPSPLRLSEAEVEAIVAAITAPVCLILGDRGLPQPFLKVDTRKDKCAELIIKTLTGGHHLHLEEAASDVAAVINEFLNQIEVNRHE